MLRIGICHFRVGETDGVSLEIAKWQRALETLGHRVFLCAGRGEGSEPFCIPELSADHREAEMIRENAFHRFSDYPCERALGAHIEEVASRIEVGLRRFIKVCEIDLLVVENIWSLSLHLPATLALWRVVHALHLPAVAHHHDFYWEKEDYRNPTCDLVRQMLAEYYPPRDPHVTHAVINRLAQAELRQRSIPSIVVPNVLDFDTSWPVDDFNQDFRAAVGLSPSDVVLLQATRVVRRKGIELAVDLAATLSGPTFQRDLRERVRTRGGEGPARPVLLLPNLIEDEAYFEQLKERIEERGVDARFISDRVAFHRGGEGVHKIYSFWDTYLFADLVTYPSFQEGWGNQFLEAIWAKLPVTLFEYPVFRTDIEPLGFEYISLGHNLERDGSGLVSLPEGVLQRAAREAATLLASPDRYRKLVEHNFELGKAHLSLTRLCELLNQVVAESLVRGQPYWF